MFPYALKSNESLLFLILMFGTPQGLFSLAETPEVNKLRRWVFIHAFMCETSTWL